VQHDRAMRRRCFQLRQLFEAVSANLFCRRLKLIARLAVHGEFQISRDVIPGREQQSCEASQESITPVEV
jgi:hypothetical protein